MNSQNPNTEHASSLGLVWKNKT